jgi:hypothetical protein
MNKGYFKSVKALENWLKQGKTVYATFLIDVEMVYTYSKGSLMVSYCNSQDKKEWSTYDIPYLFKIGSTRRKPWR